eukprot:TRINITY_DN47330_c0_g1_i1.p1 TRINITY_DN47330_c0_g1~~TRINITY_DN47330_c0_g1_i1.p1  ORF type:complete len:591 (-),score=-11.80 TRINITY_DN47330_c0_g1_i1:27-1799(-)
MPIITNALQKVSLSVFVIISLFSCSKDADLLSEYVITQDDNVQSIALLADDSFYMVPGQNTILMDVLNNDNFDQNLSVTIVETSTPVNGTVSINEDNTLTYIIPDEETAEESSTPDESSSNESTVEPEEDTFTYTAEVVDEETGATTKEEATVTVSNSSAITDMGEVLAFPGAEGFGKFTTGGRGGKVIHVTNLNDDGAGSLREAIETDGKRTIVFDVGGIINISTPLSIGSSNASQNIAEENITIAGETAPSPGITITGAGMNVYCSNVIIRYLTIRVNDGEKDTDGAEDAIRVKNWGTAGYQQKNIILDHLTLSHASDENFSLSGADIVSNISNVTFQNSMLGFCPNGYNTLVGSYIYNYSFIGNYFHETPDRNPYIGYGLAGESGEFINNLIYSNAGSLIVFGNNYDLIGNIYKGFTKNSFTYPTITYGANSFNNPNGIESDGGLFVADNISINPPSNGFYASSVIEFAKTSRVITNSFITSWETTQSDIESRVFDLGTGVGNSVHREPFDQSNIDRYFNNTGSFSIPAVPSKTPNSRSENYDTDNDGMADSWELAIFGDLSKTANGDENGDGYTNIETFLFSLVQQ